ncbi:MAG: restriction endonuclease [Methanobacteriaceae archaeon]
MEKTQLVNFMAKVMEESGFKVYKNFKTPTAVVDIYAVMSTVMGEFSTVVSCKNYEKQWEVGIDSIKEIEMIGRSLKASKVTLVTTSKFSSQSRNYAAKKNIKLVDRENLITLAKKFSKRGASLANGSGRIDSGDDDVSAESDNFDNITRTNDSEGISNNFNVSQEPYPKYNFGNGQNTSYADYDDGYTHYDDYGSSQPSSPSRSPASKLGSNSHSNVSNSSFGFGRGHVLDKTAPKKEKTPMGPIIKKILSNTIVIILIVVAISYLISLALGYGAGIGKGVRGIVQMATAALLSYSIAFITNDGETNILFKGTIVFFVSLIALIILVLML